jgi:hypothetical protein
MAHTALRDVQRMASRYAADLTDDLESWKSDHEMAMRCRDLEERLTVFNGLLQLFLTLKSRYESIAITGELDFNAKDDEVGHRIKQTCSRVSRACSEIDSGIRAFEDLDYAVESSGEFRSLRDQIEKVLQEMDRLAKIEGPMGFRGVEMAPDAVKAFRSLIDEHSNSATMSSPATAESR